MKKENAAVLTLLTGVNLKIFFIDDAIPLRNFEFRKKIALLLTKDFFSRSFQSFHERVSCNLKAIRSN